ncbi:Ohr family peroxiredoxin [Pseudoalteromonas shioyasakiensis]|jgi:Ohr subfamily peroxiredoxin|uniref:Organic hydroperoxide resistance protein n=1 Tax=Pseudoalteromonas shioyasakiensis TaxID=1190813 RepID=A0ABT6U3H5_9GAMM|nr:MULTISPECIES: organic hydroperoxide resistance protein [Pseudoalteromonas]KPM77493.1 Ohr subfamily peroxiredoxin [Pseudoalteromonas sp. UCD-33C]KPZ70581.1 Organic hydroperoxide resistance protein OhrB [Pseudoalteromonas sp. P1-26]MCO6356119.1 Ohr family peroxiredoxin [Pseudoalteromonas shioyasakiensis]MCO7205296.1 organic hydroperoxide resistance protein [Pseudoalteromonas sp. CnMc7-37]MCZ4250141.1 organic hydroperoxide resistance protein [Pseudoalteromonas shioyasakiensis]
MKELQSVAYTAKATATGGREGTAKSDDGRLDVALSTPKGLGGDDGQGTNPEQLFAAGYAACFIGALKLVAGQAKVKLPADTHINSEVSIGPIEGGFGIAVKLAVSVGDLDKDTALALVNKAHEVCPYSNATRGNIAVELSVI